MAKGSLFAFTDSDCIPDRNWLQTAIKIMTKSPDIMLIAGKIILFPKLMQAPTSVELFDAAFALNQEYAVRKKRAYTANLIIRKKVFDDIGLFFSETISGGDVEFTNRATARGYKLVYAPEMIVNHPARRTYGEYRRKIRRIVEGGYKLKDENPDFCRTFTVPSIIKGFITPFRSSFYLLGGKRCKKLGIFAKSRIIVVLFHNKYYMQYVRIKYRLGFVSVHKRL
jgi:GT2 family glycosyltransferase